MRILLFFIFIAAVTAQNNCQDCVAQNKHWCATSQSCNPSGICPTKITKALNCPQLPDAAHAYNESFARGFVLPIICGAYAPLSPVQCLKSKLPYASFYQNASVLCSDKGPDTNCYAYTAWDPINRAIIVAFRGTIGAAQFGDEVVSEFEGKTAFFDSGNLFTYWSEAFYFLWNGGLQKQIKALKYQYPDFDFWVTGHSLGGAMASIMASYAVKTGLFIPDKVKLVTFGQPRTGDYAYSLWQSNTIKNSFRIVHHRDPAPHFPPQSGPDELFHHRYEVWYNNNMAEGQPYHICEEADGLYCSSTQLDTEGDDHLWYFNKNINDWAVAGCP